MCYSSSLFLTLRPLKKGFLRSVTIPISGTGEEDFGELEILHYNPSQQETDGLSKLMVRRDKYMLFVDALHRILQGDLKERYREGLPIDVRFYIDSTTGEFKLSVQVYSSEGEELARKGHVWRQTDENPADELGAILRRNIVSALVSAGSGKKVLELMKTPSPICR